MDSRRSSRTVILVAALTVTGWSDSARAGPGGFAGSTVEFTARVSGLPGCGEVRSNPVRRVVGPGVEITSNDASGLRFGPRPGCHYDFTAIGFAVDVSDRRIDVSFREVQPGRFGEAAFNGFELRVVSGAVPGIAGAEVNELRGIGGRPELTLRREAPYGIDLNVSGLEYDRSSVLGIEVFFATLSIEKPLRVVYGRAIDAKQSAYTPTPEELLLVSIVNAIGDDDLKREAARNMRPEGTFELIDLYVQGGSYSERYISELASELAASAFPGKRLLGKVLPGAKMNAFAEKFADELLKRELVEPALSGAFGASQAERTRILRRLGDRLANDVYTSVLAD